MPSVLVEILRDCAPDELEIDRLMVALARIADDQGEARWGAAAAAAGKDFRPVAPVARAPPEVAGGPRPTPGINRAAWDAQHMLPTPTDGRPRI